METAELALLLMRPLERLLAVAIGGLCIWLGYRLFLALPNATDSQGRVVLPGGVDVRLSRIGPGAFFALFGALIVGFALFRAVAVDLPRGVTWSGPPPAISGPDAPLPAPAAVVAQDAVGYSGVGTAVAAVSVHAPDASALAGLRGTLADLNALTPQALRTGLPEPAVTDAVLALPRAKLALMQQAWLPDWGDAGAFAAWVTAGSPDPVPAGLERAAAVFRHGMPAGAGP